MGGRQSGQAGARDGSGPPNSGSGLGHSQILILIRYGPAEWTPQTAESTSTSSSVTGVTDNMTIQHLPHEPDPFPIVSSECRTIASCKRKLAAHQRTEIRLRALLARDEALLRQKDELIKNQVLLSNESDHRLLNDLQVIVSLLSLQGRASENAEVASQLAAAADRIAMIGRIHRRLQSLDGVQTFALKQYIEDLCRDFSMMLFSARSERVIVVVEELVDEAVIRADPNRTIIPGLIVDAVVVEPFGAHPSYVQGVYDRDNRFYLDWDPITRDEATTQAWQPVQRSRSITIPHRYIRLSPSFSCQRQQHHHSNLKLQNLKPCTL